MNLVVDMGMNWTVVDIFHEECWRARYDEEDNETCALFERMGEVPWSMGSLASFINSSYDDSIIPMEI
jgi:hypothetical protein